MNANTALTEQGEARAELRAMLPVGSTVNVIQRSVSKSGMTRKLSCLKGDQNVTHLVAKAMGERLDHSTGHAAIKVNGCGMDMHFHLVYSLSRVLYRDGHACTGAQGCPSNDHNNDWGRLGREYDEAHVDEYNNIRGDGIHETRTAYVAARSEWIAAQPTYDTSRMHGDGGYALGHRSL